MNIQDIYTSINTTNPIYASLIVFGISLLVLVILRRFLISRLRAISEKTGSQLDDIIIEGLEKITWPFYIAIPIYFSTLTLDLSDKVSKFTSTAALLVLVYYSIRFLEGILIHLVETIINKRNEDSQANESIKVVLNIVVKTTLWSLGILLIAQNLGLNITALLGGLGVGGIAIAFAIQATLGDLFSFFSIYFDKPVKVGDLIIIGQQTGTVEKIGIKTTRLRTLQGEELIVSNSDLTSSRINNYRAIESRRNTVSIGVEYETPLEKLKKIPEIIENILSNVDVAELDRVHFKTFGDSALLFEIVYYVHSSEYKIFMDAQQEINFAIMEKFDEEEIGFAYPTQKIFLSNSN